MVHWTISEFFCPNCGKRLFGVCNKNGIVKVTCNRCLTDYKLKVKSRRYVVLEIFPCDDIEK